MAGTNAWAGACNLRGLGGLRRRDGSVTAHGRLFRSGRVESLDAAGWRAASDAGIRTVIDLRNADEVGRTDDDPQVDESAMAFATRLHRPIEDQGNAEFMERYGDLLSHPAYYPANFEFFPDLIGAAIEAVVAAPGGVLFHCSAGKDRTGLVAAVLLVLNGVEIEDVVDDYEAGVRGYAAWQHEHPGKSRERLVSGGELDAAVADRCGVLRDWLTSVDMAALLVDGIGLDGRTVARASRLLRTSPS